MPALVVPADAEIRMYERGYEWVVAIVRAGGTAVIPKSDQAATRTTGAAVVNFAPGLCWPDAQGEVMLATLLGMDATTVFLVFTNIRDALACRERLRKERS